MDLFATAQNTKLPLYVSPIPDERAWAVDALSLDWDDLNAYAPPPAALVGKVLEKIQAHQCEIILIASAWPARGWFTQLLELLILCACQPQRTCSNKQASSVSHEPSASQSSCVEASRRKLRGQGFIDESIDRIIEPQRASTRKMYNSRWEIFSDWCKQRHRDPLKATIAVLAEFFEYLFKIKKLSPGTISGYKAALNNVLRLHSSEDISSSDVLNSVIKSMKREAPTPVNRYPKWDLAMVLNFLTESPFEPMNKAAIKYVTWKTVFLVAFATAARSSELNALLAEDIAFGEKHKFAVIRLSPEFQAKTAKQLRHVKIPALDSNARASEQDRLLCPVRALNLYLFRTKAQRVKFPHVKKLFISIKEEHSQDICKSTLAGWIRQLIVFSYQRCPEPTVRLTQAKPHEVRALASSLAWKCNLPLTEILEAACWTNHNTFTAHYLKDLSVIQGQLHRLGPVVVAQNVVHL